MNFQFMLVDRSDLSGLISYQKSRSELDSGIRVS